MKKSLQEIQNQFQSSLDNWADILLDLASKGHNSEFRYTYKDVMNMLIIFQEVTHNVSFYKNPLGDKQKELDRAEKFGEELHKLILDFTGLDTKKYYE